MQRGQMSICPRGRSDALSFQSYYEKGEKLKQIRLYSSIHLLNVKTARAKITVAASARFSA
jgi:hypothetical protein